MQGWQPSLPNAKCDGFLWQKLLEINQCAGFEQQYHVFDHLKTVLLAPFLSNETGRQIEQMATRIQRFLELYHYIYELHIDVLDTQLLLMNKKNGFLFHDTYQYIHNIQGCIAAMSNVLLPIQST